MKTITYGANSSKIIVQVSEFRGKKYLDARKYYADKSGKDMPTRKGIALDLEVAQEVINAMQEELKTYNNKKE